MRMGNPSAQTHKLEKANAQTRALGKSRFHIDQVSHIFPLIGAIDNSSFFVTAGSTLT